MSSGADRPAPLAPRFPRSKLQRPRERGDLLPRRRLLAPLPAALQHARLLLVSAPAGAGKTTLLATALADLPRASAWVALDADDNDLARFLAVLLAALGQLAPGVGAAAPAIDQALAAPAPDRETRARRAAAILADALIELAPAPGLLVLDDLHAIDAPEIYAALADLIDQLPAGLCLAVATRHDPPLPLARLRARRELIELRLDALRFTADETADLLTDRLGLALSPDELADMHRRTEGWAAGLSLLAASLSPLGGPEDRARFLAHLARSDHYIFDYLAEEVLDRQDPVTRTFLLETAVLAELTPQACRGLTGFAHAATILDELYRRNLFLVQLTADPAAGEGQAFYRYHELFRAFLIERMRREAPEWLRDLHRRAAAYVGDPLRAVEHLLQAARWEEAAAQVEALGDQLLARGEIYSLQMLIAALPDEMRAARPRLGYLLGACAWRRWDARVASALLERAADDFARGGDMLGQGEALVLLAATRGYLGDLERAAAVTERALLLPLAPPIRVQLLSGRAWLGMIGGARAQATDDLDAALGVAERAGDERTCAALGVALRGSLMGLPGALARIARLSRLAAALPTSDDPALPAAVAAMRAWSAIWRARWEEAYSESQAALERCAPTGIFVGVYAEVYLQQPVCALVAGDPAQADASIDRLLAALEPQGVLALSGRLVALLHVAARLRWLQGRLDDVRAIQERMRGALGSFWPTEGMLCREVGALIDLAAGRHMAAIEELRAVCQDPSRLIIASTLGDPRLHLAYALIEDGRPDEALAAAAPALAFIRAEGAPGRLRWHGMRVALPVMRLFAAGGPHADFATEWLSRQQG